ncbi:MAG TPA: hypothetical protein VEW42_01135 [Candidatus Eisenbacteria bacterium]|nr:hypothetical protein [Candidatus Eisenbacteria bacterium]
MAYTTSELYAAGRKGRQKLANELAAEIEGALPQASMGEGKKKVTVIGNEKTDSIVIRRSAIRGRILIEGLAPVPQGWSKDMGWMPANSPAAIQTAARVRDAIRSFPGKRP